MCPKGNPDIRLSKTKGKGKTKGEEKKNVKSSSFHWWFVGNKNTQKKDVDGWLPIKLEYVTVLTVISFPRRKQWNIPKIQNTSTLLNEAFPWQINHIHNNHVKLLGVKHLLIDKLERKKELYIALSLWEIIINAITEKMLFLKNKRAHRYLTEFMRMKSWNVSDEKMRQKIVQTWDLFSYKPVYMVFFPCLIQKMLQ